MVDFINADREERAKAAGQPFPSKGFAKVAHADFLKKVPEVLGEEHAGNYSCMFAVAIGNGATRPSKGYRFPKREACLMAMSYSYDLQAKVFDRMTALEQVARPAGPAFNIPSNLPAALRLAADQAEQIERQNAEIKLAAPKVELVDNFLSASNGLDVNAVAKELAKDFVIGRTRLLQFLRDHKILNKENNPYQEHVDARRFYLEMGTFTADEVVRQTYSLRITPKGVFYIRHRLMKEAWPVVKRAA